MREQIKVEVRKPREILNCLEPSLQSDENVSYSMNASEDSLKISFEAEKLSHLRGSSDTVYRLLSLSKKIIED